MNKAYRVVFNKAIGVWMAVSEIARGRGKGRPVVRAAVSALIAGTVLLSAPGAMAQTLIEQPDAGGPINIGRGVTGGSVNFTNLAGQNRRLTGVQNGIGTTDAVTVNQLNDALTALGGGARLNSVTGAVVAPTYTLGADSMGSTTYSTVGGALGNLDDRIKGNAASIVTNANNITNLTNGTAGMVQQAGAGTEISVAKDTDGDAVNFAGKDVDGNAITRKLTNVTAGTADTDAVNVQQLKNAGLIGNDGSVGNAVIYDDATKSSVTLNKGGDAVQLGNVADGKVEADSKDAVNGGQLNDVKSVADNAASLASNSVQYDAGGTSVTLQGAGTGPVQVKNVAEGTDDTDAVNVRQLKNTGLVRDDGSIANALVYDDATKSNITPNKSSAAVQLSNDADGKVEADSKDAVNGSQLNDVEAVADNAASVASNSVQYDAGGTSVTLQGAGTGPVQAKNVAEGTDDTDAVNVRQLKNTGLVRDDGSIANALVYDDATKSNITPNKSSAAVQLSNDADGKVEADSKDAVNGSQLNDVEAVADNAASVASNSVQYDAGGTSVTLQGAGTGPVQAKNVAEGTDDTDAVNVRQLKNTGLVRDDGSIANVVVYDDATKSSVTLNKGSAAVQLGNVADGKVEADSKDAVNGGQLNDVKSVADNAASLASNSVQYDAGGTSVTLQGAGTGPVQVKNVAEGTDDTDAVNVRQLKNTGLVRDDGTIANVVVYDDATKSSVTLNKGGDAVKLSNVANGVADNDAVNFSQLNSVGSALGGGAGFNNGVWTPPMYSFTDKTVHNNVGDALANLDGRVNKLEGATSDGGGAENPRFVGSGGSGDPATKEEAAATGNYSTASGANAVASGANSTATGANAVASADNAVAVGAHSVADRANSVSVGSVGNERSITNVAEGTQATDAVNKAQLDRVDNKVADVQQGLGNVQNQVNQVDTKVNRVGAMSAAMSTMMASAAGLQTDNRMAIGTGVYRGQAALAIGYQRKIGSRATVTIGGSTAGGSEYNVGVGAGFGW
ncbi:ESPR-type extended signal peptide-containing protein [Ralstonia sp. GX3-BWBA]|nr:ESPR-type extended signal peptide-containing protein [Ralstonia sp. GX3-BWBA]